MRSLAFALAIIGSSTPTFAQSVTLTEKSGRPLTVGAGSLAAGLSAGASTPEAVVEEFRRLCLPDPLGAAANVAASPLALQPGDVIFAANSKHGEVKISSWRGVSAALTIWAAATPDLKNEPITIDERAYQTSSVYGPFRADGDQCNLVVMMRSFDDAKKIGDLLAAAYPGGKLVVKNTFADGHWSQGETKINFTTPSTRSGSQPVHLSVQISKKGSRP